MSIGAVAVKCRENNSEAEECSDIGKLISYETEIVLLLYAANSTVILLTEFRFLKRSFPVPAAVSYTHLDVYKRQIESWRKMLVLLYHPTAYSNVCHVLGS